MARSVKSLRFPVKDSQFVKSAFSNPGGIISTCVAVAITRHGVAIRNSNDPRKKTLYFTRTEWAKFTKGVKHGEFKL